jgi:hypothetical protein
MNFRIPLKAENCLIICINYHLFKKDQSVRTASLIYTLLSLLLPVGGGKSEASTVVWLLMFVTQ